jgi:hypothetical protein
MFVSLEPPKTDMGQPAVLLCMDVRFQYGDIRPKVGNKVGPVPPRAGPPRSRPSDDRFRR